MSSVPTDENIKFAFQTLLDNLPPKERQQLEDWGSLEIKLRGETFILTKPSAQRAGIFTSQSPMDMAWQQRALNAFGQQALGQQWSQAQQSALRNQAMSYPQPLNSILQPPQPPLAPELDPYEPDFLSRLKKLFSEVLG